MEYEGIGDRFQRLTKYIRGSMPRHSLDWGRQPSPRKEYPDALQKIKLPSPSVTGGPPLWEVIRTRRSKRSYERKALPLNHLSQLLWAMQGTTLLSRDFKFRSAPSAGALYPVETYLIVNRVESLEPGLYHYDPFDAVLHQLQQDDYSAQIARSSLSQHMMEEAAVAFAWTAVIERSKWKYMERAYRYIYMDAGHIAQNLYLAATALGLGCCTAGAFYDEEVNELLGIDGVDEMTLYLAAVGEVR